MLRALALVALSLALAAPVRAQSSDASPFGVNAHGGGDDVMQRLSSIGIAWYRIDINWFGCEPAPGQYEWAVVDRVVDFCAARDLRVMGTVAYAPAWASGSSDTA